ncbi:hypothetical protein BEH93_33805 [Streptomyces sp. 2R]|nr:hypothetical protein BEH93_33805 [Streptomyces sp. 2R]
METGAIRCGGKRADDSADLLHRPGAQVPVHVARAEHADVVAGGQRGAVRADGVNGIYGNVGGKN